MAMADYVQTSVAGTIAMAGIVVKAECAFLSLQDTRNNNGIAVRTKTCTDVTWGGIPS